MTARVEDHLVARPGLGPALGAGVLGEEGPLVGGDVVGPEVGQVLVAVPPAKDVDGLQEEKLISTSTNYCNYAF